MKLTQHIPNGYNDWGGIMSSQTLPGTGGRHHPQWQSRQK